MPAGQFGVSPPGADHMPGEPEAAGDLGLARVAHVDHSQNVVGEIGEMDRGIGVAAAGVPDPVRVPIIIAARLCRNFKSKNRTRIIDC